MFRYVTIFLFFLFCAPNLVFPQGSRADSLWKVIRSASSDSIRVYTLNELGHELLYRFPDSAIVVSKEALDISERTGWLRGQAYSHSNLGNYYWQEGDYSTALDHHFKTLDLYEKMKLKQGVAIANGNIGLIYYAQSKFTEALRYFSEAGKQYEALGMKTDQTVNDINIGTVYMAQQKYPDALSSFLRALNVYRGLGDQHGIATCLCDIGTVYMSMKEDTLALKYLMKAKDICRVVGDSIGTAETLTDMGIVYQHLGENDEAVFFLRQGLFMARALHVNNLVRDAELGLSDTYFSWRKYGEALGHYKRYIEAKDSLTNEENTRKQTQTEMNYAFDKKQAKVKAEQDKKDAITESDKRKQQIILIAVAGCLLLVVAFAVFIYRSYLQKQKANIEISMQKNTIEEKQGEILASIHYAKRIQRSLLPTEKYIAKGLEKKNSIEHRTPNVE